MSVATPALDWSAPFEALVPGARFRSRARTVTEADIVSFSALTGDFHPQHSDAEWARRSPFGARIAHGMLIVSFAVGLVPLDPARVIALRRLEDVVFKRPVLIGDTLHVEGEIERTRPIDAQAGLVACRWSILNQRGELTCRARVEVLWRVGSEDPAAGADPDASAEHAGGDDA